MTPYGDTCIYLGQHWIITWINVDSSSVGLSGIHNNNDNDNIDNNNNNLYHVYHGLQDYIEKYKKDCIFKDMIHNLEMKKEKEKKVPVPKLSHSNSK